MWKSSKTMKTSLLAILPLMLAVPLSVATAAEQPAEPDVQDAAEKPATESRADEATPETAPSEATIPASARIELPWTSFEDLIGREDFDDIAGGAEGCAPCFPNPACNPCGACAPYGGCGVGGGSLCC